MTVPPVNQRSLIMGQRAASVDDGTQEEGKPCAMRDAS
jgi:hypothetical protein